LGRPNRAVNWPGTFLAIDKGTGVPGYGILRDGTRIQERDMSRYHGGLIALPTLLLVPHLVAAQSFAPPDTNSPSLESPGGPLDPWPELDGRMAQIAFVVPLDPDERRSQPRVPADADQPVLRERYAILPDPLNGWALVDRTLAYRAAGQPIPAPTAPTPRLHRVYQHWRLGPNHVLPVAKGG
jgi:hypothetical protein